MEGDLDPEALAKQLGAPVALMSAARGEGLTPVREFLDGALGVPASLDLPVLHDIPACRAWAAGLGAKAGYAAPAPPLWTRRLDAVFLHPAWGPAIFLVVVVAVFQTIFTVARPLMDLVDRAVSASGAFLGTALPGVSLPGSPRSGSLGRCRMGRRVPSADPPPVPLPRNP